jgi:hypothetical protein
VRTVEHYSGGPDKLLRVETGGCAVNVVIDLHDPHGIPFIAVEVEPRIPDDDGRVWELEGPATVLVRCRGLQVMQGDGTYQEQAESVTEQAETTNR